MRRLLALVIPVLAMSVGNAQATTITFENHAVSSGTALPQTGDLTTDGFFFDMAGLSPFYQFANNSAHVDNGSTYLVIEGTPSQVIVSPVGGGSFALTSFDYAEWQEAGTAHTITVTGNQVGGGTVSMTLNLDLIFDGPGGQPDFQSVTFGPQWANLLSVALVGTGATFGNLNYFAIDNVVVTAAVPEPGTLTLLGMGSAYLIRRRQRNRR